MYVWPIHFLFFLYISVKCDSHADENGFCETDDCKVSGKQEWYIDELAKEGPCNIEIVDGDSLTQEIFVKNYAFIKPVIIKMSPDWNKVFQKQCTKENMLKTYGNKMIRLSSANTHSYRKRDVTLQYYVDHVLKPQDINTLGNETFYWFGDNNLTEWKDLFDLYKQPHVTVPGTEGSYSFGMAGAGTGVPFHWHGPGFGEVVFGRKRWFLLPPDNTLAFNPDRTTLYWLMNEYKLMPAGEKLLECTLKPGQVIYFPDRWWHATLNLDTSIFISTFLAAP